MKNERRASKDGARRTGFIGASGQLPATAPSAAVALPTVVEGRGASQFAMPDARDLVWLQSSILC